MGINTITKQNKIMKTFEFTQEQIDMLVEAIELANMENRRNLYDFRYYHSTSYAKGAAHKLEEKIVCLQTLINYLNA